MSRGYVLILAGAIIASFAAGALTEKAVRKPERIRVDARPGVEVEVKLAKGFEPKTIVCRLDDGKENGHE